MGSPASEGRRARHRQSTKDRLYEAAVTLFAEEGFESTTVEEIADRADVSRATAFNYFPRKADYVFEWGARRRMRVEHAIQNESLDDQGIAVLLRRCAVVLAATHTADRGLSVGLMGAWFRSGGTTDEPPYLAELIAAHVAEAQQRGQVRADLDPLTVGHLFRDSFFGVLSRWLVGENEPYDLEKTLLSSLDIVIAGVVT